MKSGRAMIEMGARLRQERKRLGLSQKELGQLGGVAANAQGKYESGERVPKADYLAALASIGVDVLYVLTDKRSTGLEVDNVFNRLDMKKAEVDPLFTEVQLAVRQFVSTIEELSNTYDINGK